MSDRMEATSRLRAINVTRWDFSTGKMTDPVERLQPQVLWVGAPYPDPNRRGECLICDCEWRDVPTEQE